MIQETVSRRRFKSPYWDVPPIGYEDVSTKEYKDMQAAGQIPHSVVNPSSQILQGTKHAHPDPLEAAKAAAAKITAIILSSQSKSSSSTTRQARRLYVGNIPFNVSETELIDFFQSNLSTNQPGSVVLSCQINNDKNFAFVEFRTVEDTSNALALDGVLCKSQTLKIRRPHDYKTAVTTPSQKVLPPAPLKTGAPAPVQIQVPGMQPITSASVPRVLTEVLCLMNMVEAHELIDDEEYQDILDDIRDKCAEYGRVKSIEIPRPIGEDELEHVPGLGKVFVEFDSATEAQQAQINLAGRRFADRVVVISYFDRDRYRNKEF